MDMHKNTVKKNTQEGFMTFIFMVFIACGVAWWNGWDQLALKQAKVWIDKGIAAKEHVIDQAQDVKTLMQKHDEDVFKTMDDPILEAQGRAEAKAGMPVQK
jgi:hypothetical protein